MTNLGSKIGAEQLHQAKSHQQIRSNLKKCRHVHGTVSPYWRCETAGRQRGWIRNTVASRGGPEARTPFSLAAPRVSLKLK
jgi:hypothetical protein